MYIRKKSNLEKNLIKITNQFNISIIYLLYLIVLGEIINTSYKTLDKGIKTISASEISKYAPNQKKPQKTFNNGRKARNVSEEERDRRKKPSYKSIVLTKETGPAVFLEALTTHIPIHGVLFTFQRDR